VPLEAATDLLLASREGAEREGRPGAGGDSVQVAHGRLTLQSPSAEGTAADCLLTLRRR